MDIKTPPFLHKNGTIGVTAPSFGCTTEPYISRYKEAVRIFTKKGFKIQPGKTVFKSDGIGISSSPEFCAKELTDFYCSNENDIIISAGGGELMCQTLSYIDFEKIKSAPAKWFCGYSDNTNFIHPLLTLCNVKSVYSHNITGFGKIWEKPEEDTFDLLTGRKKSFSGYKMFQDAQSGTEAKNADPLSAYVLTQKKELKLYPECSTVSFCGIMAGGCLDVLTNLAGTKFDGTTQFIKNAPDKIIWALEACDLSVLDIRRAMWHLDECGWFKSAAGFIIGRPLSAWKTDIMGTDQYKSITDIVGKYKVPVIMDADIGHLAPTMPLVMGADTKVQVENGEIFLDCTL